MNIPSILEISNEVRSKDWVYQLAAPLRRLGSSLAKFRMEKGLGFGRASSGIASSYRLGEAVNHDQFGSGRVVSQWPDGRLLVRFDGEVKSRLVFPSILD